MPEILQLGPFMLKYNWLLWAIAAVVGYSVMKYRLKKAGQVDKSVLEVLSTALLIAIITWKLSPLLLSTEMWKNPLSVLFVSGSDQGAIIGFTFAFFYTGIKCWKKESLAWKLPDLLSYGITVMVIVYNMLSWKYGSLTALPWGISIMDPNHKYHPVNVYLILVSLPIIIWLWRRPSSLIGSGELFASFLSFFGIGLLVVSFFENQTMSVFVMSWKQLFYLVMVLCGIVLNYVMKKKQVDQLSD
ncbi:prolipoprotein diacylglyceryl transferase family protein [Paenibacillus alginolyticus]|uniref:Prolipoprotein diacylglyceryl transferase n=1 Tax=Paenibacillus alginolyticus TaxID=59839 RepID=A0ABT4GB48_9BACL|nr:prolipoprotein diacylglyceryl transferase family protein [Paenibacillus alginolyticus]MCY9693412.1 prolipoprotein diacylglyceryl transferase [Paenibacillus alginolyticus]MEC0144671.1 prolipoprotein diacylglyceryl transferase [Paenibacillus alginolyticus]